MKHLIRAGGLLLGVLVLVFVALRLVPDKAPLTAYGFYKGHDNSDEWSAQPLQYADPNTCGTCHEKNYNLWKANSHKTVSCENCHGPGQTHEETISPMAINDTREACGVCHAKLDARPSTFPQIDLAQHGGTASCTTCHNPHSPKI
jgi:hypothetical protein